MIGLSLSKNGIYYDFQLILIVFKGSFLLNIPGLIFGFSVTEDQATQLRFLPTVEIVWSDQVEPTTKILAILLSVASDLDVGLVLLFEFSDDLSFSLAPSSVKSTFDFGEAILVVYLSLLFHFRSHVLAHLPVKVVDWFVQSPVLKSREALVVLFLLRIFFVFHTRHELLDDVGNLIHVSRFG